MSESIENWMALSEVYQKVMDVVIGYRTSAVHGGFDPHMADYMAVQLHTAIINQLFAS